EDQRAHRLLELFSDIQDQLSVHASEVFATALVKIGDSIHGLRQNKFGGSPEWVVLPSLWKALEKLDSDRCKTWIETQLAEGGGLYYLISLVSLQREDGAEPLKDNAIFNEQATSELEQHCVAVISKLAEQGQLLTAKDPDYLLSRWQKWTKNPDEVKSYVVTQTDTPERALELLSLYIRPDHPEFSEPPPTGWYRIELSELRQWLDLHQLDATLSSIDRDSVLLENHQRALDAWERTVRLNLTQTLESS
nr:hypothetical protein [Caldilineaceae bacterium]